MNPAFFFAFILAAFCFSPQLAWADTAGGGSLDLFLRSGVDKALSMKPAEAREELARQIPKIRSQQGSLIPLCNYLRSHRDVARAKPLLATALMANQQYQEAAKVLGELEKDPNSGPWVSAELARCRQLLDLKTTWDLLGGGDGLASLTPAEKERIDGILSLAPEEAKAAMKEACQDLLSRYGDLAPLVEYLHTLADSPLRNVIITMAAIANGDLLAAEKSLSKVAEDPATDAATLAELGRIKEMRGRTEEAAALFKRSLKKTDDSETRFALGIRTAQLLYGIEDMEQAREMLRSIAGPRSEDSAELGNFCARIALLNGDQSLFAELFVADGQGKKLMQNHLFLGESLLRLGKSGEARKSFAAALPMCEIPRDRLYVLDRLVGTARTTNTLPELMDDWLKSDDLSPDQVDVMASVLGGELGRASEIFGLIGRSDLPEKTREYVESPEFQERLASLSSDTGRSTEIARNYRDLMARFPDEMSYREGYVRLLLMNGDQAAAVSAYREAIAGTENAGTLMRIASGARRTGLRDVAIEAATKAGKVGGATPFESGLFISSLYREQSETDRAVEILRKLEDGIGEGDADRMMSLSQAFERLGYAPDAIRLCRNASELSGSEETLRKLILLLEGHNQQDEAFVLWRKLWETAGDPMTIIQANERLLELGSRSAKLADLAIELEDRLADGGLNEREITLLLDIYTSVGDPVSAADVIMELSESQGGESIGIYKRLLKVYMESELFGKCNEVLRKLIEIDPENRDEHLQLLAIIALERRNNGDAMVVLEELAGRTEDGILRDSFSASMLDMLGKHVDAAHAHRRAMVDNPGEVESWLLWGNALAARDAKERAEILASGGKAPAPETQEGNRQTRELFTVLLEEAGEDDLFVICIDGLLNARAPRHTMLNALRRLNERIAANPHNLLLYQLVSDINEDLKRPRESSGAMEMALPVADDSRPIIMRELIATASAEGRSEDAIRYGRSLLNIAEHLPPDECLSLGGMLLGRGYVAEAEAAFQRIVSDPNAVNAAQGVASVYEKAGLFEQAGKVIRTVMIGNPFDVELQLRLGMIEEKRGDSGQAGIAFSKALDLMVYRLPSSIDSDAAATGSSRSVSDIDQYLDLALRGIIASAGTPEARERLVDVIRGKVRAEVAGLDSRGEFAGSTKGNPRLRYLAAIMRRIGFVLHRADQVNELDAELLSHYPGDSGLRKEITAARRQWQTETDAVRFLAQQGIVGDGKALETSFADGRQAVEKALEGASLSPAERSMATVLLTVFGHDDLVGGVLSGLEPSRTPEDDGELLVAAGLVTNRPGLISDVLLTNLNRLRRELAPLAGMDRSRLYLRPTKLYKQIVAAWPGLSPRDRSTAASIYGMCIEKSDGMSELTASYHFLLALAGRSNEIGTERMQHYLERGGFYYQGYVATIFDRWLQDQPAARRPAAIRQLLGAHTGSDRTQMLARLGSYLSPGTLTDGLRSEFPEMAARRDETPLMDPEGAEYAAEMTRQRMRFAQEISTALRSMGSDVRRMFPLHDITLRPAANMLPPQELDLLLKGYRDSSDPFEMLTAFLLLRHAGREAEALPLMQSIGALLPDTDRAEATLAIMPNLLNNYGWNLPGARLAKGNSKARVPNLHLDFSLHDPLAILADPSGDTLDLDTRRMHASRLMPSPAQFREAARIFYADTRHPEVATDHRSSVKALQWPGRIEFKPGGLLERQLPKGGSILVDVAKLEDGQDELLEWLSSLTPTWLSGEKEASRQIAAAAGRGGLSPKIRQDLQTAVERSALNLFDMNLIEALAMEAPESIPGAFAGKIEKLALHNWRGDSQWDPRYKGVRKRMGLDEDAAKRMAALAIASRELGRNDLAVSLSRWSVAMDLLETGSPRYLGVYLDSLPAQARRQALADMLPYLGLQDARPLTGEGFGAVLQEILNEGMTGEAGDLVDRYLRQRLMGYSLQRFSTTSEALIGGYESDQKIQDDAVAVALARLGRPDDYGRLLWRKNMDTRVQRSPLNLGMNIGELAIIDNTGALPEPGQVPDVGRFLDIQLGIGKRMRQEGFGSAENQVAQICMLGQWCHERGLGERAGTLLKQAEDLSREMLYGRLWVADLQRLLGMDATAEEIELDLLRKDLLPMPRVAAALAALERTEGISRADASAYRLSRFSNHPEVLARAVRYAREQELRQEFIDLAERQRQIHTLFLHPGAPCPFEGYASVAAWSADISATATKLPEVPKPRPLAALADDDHPAIGHVIIRGEKPEMIYVPIIHDTEFSHLSSEGTDDVKAVMIHCEEIADLLYRRYGIRNVQLEGLSKSFVDQYNKIPLERRYIVGEKNAGMVVHRTWTSLLAEKSWVLIPASDQALVGPLTALGREYGAHIVGALDEAKTNGWLRNQEGFQQNKAKLQDRLDSIAEEYNAKHRALLKEDPGLKREYDITVTQRNKEFLDRLLAPKDPGVVFFGVGHWQDLEHQLAERKVSYAVVVPAGMTWPPKVKDDAARYSDMLQLGADLRDVHLTLGDGTSESIKIPID